MSALVVLLAITITPATLHNPEIQVCFYFNDLILILKISISVFAFVSFLSRTTVNVISVQ